MGPSDVQEVLDFEPFTPFRMTLSSGDVIDVRHREGVNVTGMAMFIVDTNVHGRQRVRLVSVPNIALIEPLADRAPGGRVAEGDE